MMAKQDKYNFGSDRHEKAGKALEDLFDTEPSDWDPEQQALLAEWLSRAALKDKQFSINTLSQGHIYDGKTEAFNNDYFEQRVKKDIDSYARGGNHVSVLYVDIDHFKEFNDSFGHEAGDYVLAETRKVLEDNTRNRNSESYSRRSHDKVSRIDDITDEYDGKVNRPGGEEFVIFLKSGLEGAKGAAERIRGYVQAHPYLFDGKDLYVTVSIGVAEYNPSAEGVDKAVKRADDAMYYSKNHGRNLASSVDMKGRYEKITRRDEALYSPLPESKAA